MTAPSLTAFLAHVFVGIRALANTELSRGPRRLWQLRLRLLQLGLASGIPPYEIRKAVRADIPALRQLMNRAIDQLQRDFLSDAEIVASFEIMGLDTQLVDDGTYYVVEAAGELAGCGGWSRRATLFGGDSARGRDARLLDPTREPARVRAMYTDPAHTRRGVGRLVLVTCEAAALREGFRQVELGATLAGEPLYRACGYRVIEKIQAPTSSEVTIPVLRMGKALALIS